MLYAPPEPRFSWETTRTRESSAGESLGDAARVASVEPSSTMTSSQSAKVCACTDSTVWASVASALYAGIVTEKRGLSVIEDAPVDVEDLRGDDVRARTARPRTRCSASGSNSREVVEHPVEPVDQGVDAACLDEPADLAA